MGGVRCAGGMHCVGGVHCLRGVHCVGELRAPIGKILLYISFTNNYVLVIVIWKEKQFFG